MKIEGTQIEKFNNLTEMFKSKDFKKYCFRKYLKFNLSRQIEFEDCFQEILLYILQRSKSKTYDINYWIFYVCQALSKFIESQNTKKRKISEKTMNISTLLYKCNIKDVESSEFFIDKKSDYLKEIVLNDFEDCINHCRQFFNDEQKIICDFNCDSIEISQKTKIKMGKISYTKKHMIDKISYFYNNTNWKNLTKNEWKSYSMWEKRKLH